MSGDQGAQWKQGNVSMSNAYADFYVSVIGDKLKISMSTTLDVSMLILLMLKEILKTQMMFIFGASLDLCRG